MAQITEDLLLTKDFQVNGTARFPGNTQGIKRSDLTQDNLCRHFLAWGDWRVWDAITTILPSAGAADDLGLIGGTFGTDTPSIQTGDLKAAGATDRYARIQFLLPPEYADGETIGIRAHAGMLTTVADVSATLDFEVYKSDKEAGAGADLVSTAATTINSLTLADKDFTVTPTGLVRGDLLDIRVKVSVNDAATGTAVIGILGSVEILLDIKG